ncbi:MULTISPECIES: DEAD/DEAH box helicase [unclassified Clostridioides]|uniref:DEAD/DEAH box helicase n=1 Tax=unclassified Clostridioides TaxID=2635829 RepID=UPI001D0C5C06|nr:DEAD/DEAH box helicase [Clostridioides sp. ES-S-0001-02]MCC0638758.1 DEAD/DEAH box helicase [Clostridioides sp. ES-S-0049-03]MCC0652407.1 DEAD/DEAH box helicase [Clostridioides sp. ES-S-0001-03]MCC0655078.1 DEAD/DEAH box helicase [Clostridioides sp. ES-S-0123-01]MCC0675146.1 DEAD/DEAH box helicase [Clostridioides sp. ES-W-0018-02]MCC0679757.1 DEAD/DEAH box helicase [Clostridioides sp. ES-S-0005-03]MCC0695105.1 DEAD/DEAH box helicase [Clostridioides sp. ES-S-0048-02]MCC0702150.1 DEAD/DEAH 
MNTFEQLKISSTLINGLKKQDITSPTEVQSLVIENIMQNKDLLINSQTGTGKTLAYVLPIFERIDTSKRETQALILAPTHELVMQITNQIELLAKNSETPLTSLSLIGEVNIQKQIKNIKAIKPHIVIGTCGRVLDLIKQKKLKSHNIKTIVLDEVDNLLNGKNITCVEDIIKTTLRDRQIIGCSASLTDSTIKICDKFMKEFELIKTKEKSQINPNINHTYMLGEIRDKFNFLRKTLAATNPKRAIVFVNNEKNIDVIVSKLNYHNYKAIGIFGNMPKEDRKNAINKFKLGKAKILVTTDLSARGLDIVDISHVFNLDFPNSKNEYLHRCGRTARGNRSGDTISIITKKELDIIKELQKEFNITIVPKTLEKGKLVDISK